MVNKFFSYYNHVNCLSQLKCSPKYQKLIIHNINNILDSQFLSKDYFDHIIRPCTTLGQYDILFGIPGENAPDVSRKFYAFLDTLNKYYPAAIRDFYKSLIFEWDLNTLNLKHHEHNYKATPREEDFLLAYVSIKYSDPEERKDYSQLAAHAIIKEIFNVMVINNGLNDNKSYIDLRFRAFGSMTWNELVILCYGKEYQSVINLCVSYRKSKYGTTRKWNYAFDQELSNNAFPPEMIISTQMFPPSCFVSPTANAFSYKYHIDTKKLVWSNNHVIVSIKPYNLKSFSNYFNELVQLPGLEYTNSAVYRQVEDILDENICTSDNIKADTTFQKSIDDRDMSNYYEETLLQIVKHSLPRRKLMALRTEIEIISNIDQYRNIFPLNILDSIDFLIDRVDQFSDETVQYYISEFSNAMRDKIAGSQLDVIIGKDIGFLEQHGSYPRLTFACEGFFDRCINIYLSKINRNVKKEAKPVLLAFFDYGSRLSGEMPPEILCRGLDTNLPIVIRMNMSRYKPWLWAQGLRQISGLIFLAGDYVLSQMINEDPNVTLFGDMFIRQFFSRKNFSKIIQEEIGFVQNIGDGKYQINYDREDQVRNKISECEKKHRGFFICDTMISNTKIIEFENKLLKGEFVFEMTDKDFVNFINAYFGLSRREQMQANCFVAFVVSLYWDLWKQRRIEHVCKQ